MIVQKVQLDEEALRFVETACVTLGYPSKSAYLREAILAKIDADRRAMRQLKREEALRTYGEGQPESAFTSIEGEDFAEW